MPVCGLFRSQGLRFSRFNASFRHLVWGVGGFVQRFRGLAPRCSGAVRRFASVHRAVVEKARRFSTYPQFVFHSLFHGVEKMSTFPCVSPRLSVFPPQGAPIPLPPRGGKVPLRARVYINRSGERQKGQRAVRRLSLWKRVARCEGGRPVAPPRGERPHGRAGGAERSGGVCRQWAAGGARRDGASESGRSGALRLHPSRNGRRGTGAPRPMRLHNSRSILSIVSE